MQYLYVLVSSQSDVYYEQFLLSLVSLRLLMPDADVVLLYDSATKENLAEKRSGYKRFVSRTVTIDSPAGMSQVEISRWLKTSMRRHVNGDFLFIDCDTIITDDLYSISKARITLGACLDKHSMIDRHGKGNSVIEKDKQLGFTSYFSNRHINSGVIFCADVPEMHTFFDRWHELWLFGNGKNTIRDQPSFNMAIHENPSLFTELGGTWNCQIAFNGLPFLSDAKIIHYFASDLVQHASPFALASNDIFMKIKKTGVVPDGALELLKNPRAAFVSEVRIVAGEDMLYVLNSNVFEALLLLRQRVPGLFSLFNRLGFMGKKIAKSFLVRSSRRKDGGIKYYN